MECIFQSSSTFPILSRLEQLKGASFVFGSLPRRRDLSLCTLRATRARSRRHFSFVGWRRRFRCIRSARTTTTTTPATRPCAAVVCRRTGGLFSARQKSIVLLSVDAENDDDDDEQESRDGHDAQWPRVPPSSPPPTRTRTRTTVPSRCTLLALWSRVEVLSLKSFDVLMEPKRVGLYLFSLS